MIDPQIGSTQRLQLLAVREVVFMALNVWAIDVLFALVQPFRRTVSGAHMI